MSRRGINLLEETIQVLKKYGKTPKDVLWVGSVDGEYAISWEEFEKIAENVWYYNGYGSQEIAYDLVVVGDDWWLERVEYDGSEWWEIRKKPEKKPDAKPFRVVGIGAWDTLKELNKV